MKTIEETAIDLDVVAYHGPSGWVFNKKVWRTPKPGKPPVCVGETPVTHHDEPLTDVQARNFLKFYEMRNVLHAVLSGFYDHQKLRNAVGNRLLAAYYPAIGLPIGAKVDGKEVTAQEALKLIRGYSNPEKVMRNYQAVTALASHFESLVESETELLKGITKVLDQIPFWNFWLSTVQGIGPLMGAVCLSRFNPYISKYPSSLHKFAGLDIGPDGKGRSRRKEHLVVQEYYDTHGEKKEKKGLGYDPFVKTKLVGVFGDILVKQKPEKSKYKQAYVDYKHRMENHPKYGKKAEPKPGHRHRMAIRYAVKLFLTDLYKEWRKFEGLNVAPPYEEAKLGIVHTGTAG